MTKANNNRPPPSISNQLELRTPPAPLLPRSSNQVPDGEFLCPKCKTDEAAAPPLTPSKLRGGATTAAQSNGPSVKTGESGHQAGDGVNAGGSGAGGEQKEGQAGVGGVPGISMLATDGSTVDLTQIAM